MQIGTFIHMPMMSMEGIKEELLFYANNGIKLVGLIFECPFGPYNVDEKWVSGLEGVLKRLGILTVIHAPFVMNNLLSICEKYRKLSVEEIRMSIDFAKRLGSHSVTFHMGWTTEFSRKGNLYKKASDESLGEILDYAERKNVELSIETVPLRRGFRQNYPQTENEMKELEKISSDIKFCIDVGHVHEGGINVYGFLERFINRTNCIHIHDSTKKEDHLVVGKGEIDFRRIFSILKKFGYNDPILIENINKEECMESYNKLREMGLI